jgi:two-component system sensor histidine kinase VicK
MFERFLAVPLHFTIEFLGFLVVAGGAFLVPSRPSLLPGTKTNRWVAATGFAALGAAQILHGGAFEGAVGDSERLLIAIKTIGFALILMGIVGAARPSTGAYFAQGAGTTSGLIEFLPAISAATVAFMALVISVRSSKELRRLAIGLVFVAAAEALIPLAESNNTARLAGTYELASHLVRTAGYFWVAAWLWTGVRSSIRTRFVASFVALLLAVVLALSSALTGVIANNVEKSELDNVSDRIASVESALGGSNLRAMTQQVTQAAASENVICSISDCDAPSFAPQDVARATQTNDLIKADAVLILDGKKRLAGFAGHAGNVGRNRTALLTPQHRVEILGSGPVQVVVKPPLADSSVDLVRVGGSVAVVGVSNVPPGRADNAVGVLVLVDFLDFLTIDDVRRNVGTAASLVVGKRVTASTLGRDIVASDLVPQSVQQDLEFAQEGVVAEPQTLGGNTYYSAIAALEDDSGFSVGYLVLSSPSRIVTTAREAVTRTLFLVALGVGAIVLLLAYYSGSRITRPIQTLTETAQRIREGDLKAQADVAGEDEVGQLGETFNEMTGSLFRMTNDLRQAARDEHQLRAQVEAIIESMADGLVAVGADGTVIAFNREAEHITGLKAKAVTGKPIQKVLDARDGQGAKVSLPIFDLAEGSTSGIFIHKKGTEPVPIAVVSAALRTEEGETDGGVAVLRNMTREREVERMKSEFLSNISHELRTPLTPIKGYAEILDKKEVPAAKVKQFTRGILDSTAKLERIVELLVDFAALEAGRLSPRSASVDLAAIVEKLANDWEARTPRHTVVADVGKELPKVVGDERLLRRSLEEILDNAVKFSPQGGTITLSVSGENRQNGDERRRRMRTVEVTVSDEGIGIPEEDMPKIFSDFHQLDGSETRSYGGLGLGLAFVRRIIEAHDGSVSVQSELDEGTRLTVTLPAAKDQAGEASD